MTVYEDILKASVAVDNYYQDVNPESLKQHTLTFPVGKNHPRYSEFQTYKFSLRTIQSIEQEEIFQQAKRQVVIVDKAVAKKSHAAKYIQLLSNHVQILSSTEHEVKTISFAKDFIATIGKSVESTVVVAIGGGLILNFGAYVAEQLQAALIQCPTTVLSLADSAGGKVRLNTLSELSAKKHQYKTFYEPNCMIFDSQFLETLPLQEKRIGFAEIVKHGLFQSKKLLQFIEDNAEKIVENNDLLLKAGLWALALKKACLEIDIDETTEGSEKVLRAGHTISDTIEEEYTFHIPHGVAVAIGIVEQLKQDNELELLSRAKHVFSKLHIPFTREQFNKQL